MAHTLEDVLRGLRQQLQETEEELAPIERELCSRVGSPGRREALRRRQGRLLHSRQLLTELIARLTEQIEQQR